jgi:hypothetical protein
LHSDENQNFFKLDVSQNENGEFIGGYYYKNELVIPADKFTAKETISIILDAYGYTYP